MKSNTWIVNECPEGAHSSFSDTLGILSRYWRGNVLLSPNRVYCSVPGFWSWFFFVTFRVLVHLESSLHRKHSLSGILCFLGCCPPGWDAKSIWKGGLKTKNPWDWMATRITSETENNGLWTVHSTLHRCVWLKPTDSVNAFEVWFDSCLKFCFCQKNTN